MARRRHRQALALLLGIAFSVPASAGSFSLFDTIDGQYKLTLGYGLAMRMEQQSQDLLNGPVDPFQSQPPSGPDHPYPTFTHTGLSSTINYDDGNRNFKQYSLINNRLSAYGELDLKWGDFGVISSGAAFYDWVYHHSNDNDSTPDSDPRSTVNKDGAPNIWTDETKRTNGQRKRLLDFYGYWNYLAGPIGIDLRAGRLLNAWGESLFFPGIVTAQNPNNATKAFVPGAEVKEILLPVEQVSLRLGLGQDFTLLGYYQFKYRVTEIFPEGDYFSPADVVGPGATFAYGSANPAFGSSCPGLLDFGNGVDFSDVCNQNGIGAGVFNAGPFINAQRGPDILPPDKGQYGVGMTYQLTSTINTGLYYLHYHNHNPGVRLNVGFAPFGDVGGVPLSTEANQQYVPTSYNVTYADNIKMMAASWSAVFLGWNFAGEFIHRENIDVPVEATISGVVAPYGSRGKTNSAQMSWLYTTNPDFLFYDEIPFVGEVSYMKVQDITPVANQPGICISGTTDCNDFSQKGDVLFYNRSAWAFTFLMLPKGRNVFGGWDLGTPLSFGWLVRGTPSVAGQFAALYGEGDMRVSPGITLQRLQNLELAFGYNFFFGDAKKKIGNSLLPANPYTDHDYATFTIKYNL